MVDKITRKSNNSNSTKGGTVTRTRTNYNAQNIRDTSNSNNEELETLSEEESGYRESENTFQNKPVKYRIGALVSLGLLFVAGYLDIIELVIDLAGTALAGVGVVVGYIKDAFTLFIFPSIFFILGVPFWKGKKAKKKMTAMVSGFAISLIPWVGAFMPETLVSVAVTIYLTRAEDRERVGRGTSNSASKITRARRMRSRR